MAVAHNKRNIVKNGQHWKKRDTGVTIEILKKAKSPYYRTIRVNKNKKNGVHQISLYDLLKYYDLLS